MVDNSSNWNTTILSIFFGILLLFLIFLWFESREEDSDGNKVFNPEKLGIILKNIFGLCFPDIILIFFANLCICCGYVGTSCLEQIQAEEEIRETKRLARLAANLSKKSKQKKKKVKSRSQSDNEFEAVSSADEDDDIELGSNSGSSTGRRSKRSLSSSNSSNNNSNDNSNNSNSNNNNNNNNKINQKSSVSFPTHSNRVVNNSPGYDQNDRNERGAGQGSAGANRLQQNGNGRR